LLRALALNVGGPRVGAAEQEKNQCGPCDAACVQWQFTLLGVRVGLMVLR
jgi:hypothetical protein